MVIIKNAEQINGIRRSSQLAAQTLQHLESYIKPGITTESLNQIAHQFIVSHGAIPAPLN